MTTDTNEVRTILRYLGRGAVQLLITVAAVLALFAGIFVILIAGGLLIDAGYPWNIFGWTWYGIEFVILLICMGSEKS